MPLLTDEERLGSVLAGRYRIDSIVGRGGMGTVFAGEHEWTGRKIAVKLLKASLIQESEAIGRLRREARAATSIDHPNAVDVLDLGRTDDGAVFVVMELLDGVSLRQLLRREGRLAPRRTLELLLPAMGALARAHDLGFIHRDLKPDNIFVATNSLDREQTKLLDFGVAKALGGESLKTVTGALLGTPLYMSPEQLQDSKWVSPATDVWSMGIVLYELLSGSTPFAGESLTELAVKVMLSPVPPIRERVPELGEQLAGVIDCALQREPTDRFSNMRAFAAALMGAAQRDGIEIAAPIRDMALPPERAPLPPRKSDAPGPMIPPTQLNAAPVTPVTPVATAPGKPGAMIGSPSSRPTPVAAVDARPSLARLRLPLIAAAAAGALAVVGVAAALSSNNEPATPVEPVAAVASAPAEGPQRVAPVAVEQPAEDELPTGVLPDESFEAEMQAESEMAAAMQATMSARRSRIVRNRPANPRSQAPASQQMGAAMAPAAMQSVGIGISRDFR